MYSGSASELEDGSSGLGVLSLDWESAGKKFGYFSVFSDKDKCASKDYLKSIDFGPSNAKKFAEAKVATESGTRSYLDEKTIK